MKHSAIALGAIGCLAWVFAGCSQSSPPPVAGSVAEPATLSSRGTTPFAVTTAGGDGKIERRLDSAGRPFDLVPKSVPGEFLVKFRRGASKTAIGNALRKVSPSYVQAFKVVPELRRVRLAKGASLQAAMAVYRARPDVEYVEPNYLRHASAIPDDPDFGQQWGLHNVGQTGGLADADIDAPEAWDLTTGSSDVVVAVIDSGVKYDHPALAANMFTNTADCNNDGVDDDGDGYVDDCHGIDTYSHDSDPMDQFGHGTHVAGIIGARGNDGIGPTGVAWSVKILPCKFMDEFGYGSDADAIECLDYIATLRARGVNIVATNNSWGGFFPGQAMYDAIRAQMNAGILFVAAAGNSGFDNDGSLADYPCSFNLPNILCVASSTDKDALSSFSSYGSSTVHLEAPGSNIYSTYIDLAGYETFSGTSMAAPHVTGALVLLAAQQPSRDWRALKNLIIAGVDQFSYGITISEGRLNARNSLTCTNTSKLARLRPFKNDDNVVAVGAHVKLQALNIRCDHPDGNVVVSISPGGGSVTLLDDGQGDDLAAGDGIYTGAWVPAQAGDYQLTFPEVVPDVVNFTVDGMLKPGFPVYNFGTTGTMQGGPMNAVVVGNIDDDPQLEILASGMASGPLYAWKYDGTPIQGWEELGSAGAAYPVLGEFDGDPKHKEVHVSYFEGAGVIYDSHARPLPGWPLDAGESFPAAAADLDGDGRDEVISGIIRQADGSPLNADIGPYAPPAVADIDVDGRPDVVWASSSNNLYAVDASGEYRPGFPAHDARADGTGATQSPVLGDVDGDGDVDIVLASRTNSQALHAQVHVFSSRGVFKRTRELDTQIYHQTTAVLADLDGDGIPEILVQTNTRLYAMKGDLTDLPGWPVDLGNSDLTDFSPVVGDVDGDGQPDVVVLTQDAATEPGWLRVYDRHGTLLSGFPKRMRTVIGGMTPAIADIDLDGRNDILVGVESRVGVSRKLWAYDLHGAPNHGPIEWGQWGEGASHRAFYELGKNLPNDAFLTVRIDGGGSVSSDDGKIGCGADCIERYAKGTKVTLTATPPTGGRLTKWRGACSGQSLTCVVDVSKYTAVAADFTTRTLSTTVLNGSLGSLASTPAGIDCGATCTAEFVPGDMVTITAVPTRYGYFGGWLTSDCSGSEPTCTLRMDRARTAKAVFYANPILTVHLIGPGPGHVTSSPDGIDCIVTGGANCSAPFPRDSRVTLTGVSTDYRYQLTGWSNSCDVYDPGKCTFRISGDRDAYAVFDVLPGFRITLTGTGSGTITSSPSGIDCGSTCIAAFPRSTQVTLTATAAANSAFTGWSGACSGSSTTCRLGPTQMTDIGANFDLKPIVSVVRAGTGSGTVTSNPAGIDCGTACSTFVAPHASVTLTATPAADSTFTGWSGSSCGTSATCTTVVDADLRQTATFAIKVHMLTVTLAGGGSGSVASAPAGISCGADCSEGFTHGANVTLTASTGAGSNFGGWSGACSGASATCSVTMDDAQSVIATFNTNSSGASGGGSTGGGGKGGGGRIDLWMLMLSAVMLAWRWRHRRTEGN